MTALVGWASSVILLVTIGKQLHKQWQDRTSEGVSKWLLGQLAASVGFTDVQRSGAELGVRGDQCPDGRQNAAHERVGRVTVASSWLLELDYGIEV